MLNSYKRYSGTDTTSIVKGSPEGVITAASTATVSTAYFLLPANVPFFKIPNVERATTTVGNSNTIPKVSTIEFNSEIYELKENVFCISGLT